jgi:hypothetical protein
VKTIRELSVAGPCITLGLVLRETDRRISYRDRHGTPKFISRRWAIHTEPCPSCPDHPRTKYRRIGSALAVGLRPLYLAQAVVAGLLANGMGNTVMASGRAFRSWSALP